MRVGDGGGVAGLAPALELVDLDISFDDIEPVLAGDVSRAAVWSSAPRYQASIP